MDEEFSAEFEAGSLFGDGICEICGRTGTHPACLARALEVSRQFRECDARLLKQYALHGVYGVAGPESRASFDLAVDALQRYLGRPLQCKLDQAIEGARWWFIPEGWIGMIGFIVEKDSQTLYPLGSGLVGRSKLLWTPAHWCAIVEYLGGHIEPVVQ